MPGELGNEETQFGTGYYEHRYPSDGGEWMNANYGNMISYKDWRKKSPQRGMISRIMKALKNIHEDGTEEGRNEPECEAGRGTKSSG